MAVITVTCCKFCDSTKRIVVRSVQTRWRVLEVCVFSLILGSLLEIYKVQILCTVP